MNGLHENLGRLLLSNDSSGTCLERKQMRFHVLDSRQHQNPCRRERSNQPWQEIDTTLVAQTQVEQDNVESMILGESDCSAGIWPEDDFDSALIFDQHAYTANNRMVSIMPTRTAPTFVIA
jgi:hypothetical protein